MEWITRIRDKLEQITYEWEWAKYFCKELKEGWCLRFSMDHRGVWSRAGGWVDSGSQMGGGQRCPLDLDRVPVQGS